MRIVRFAARDERPGYGLLEGDSVRPLKAPPFQGIEPEAGTVPLGGVRLLAPVVPTKVIAVGLNYTDHAAELRMEIPAEPLLFLKPPSAVIGPGEPIRLPPQSRRVDHEAELALVVGKRARRVKAEEARDFILGYTCLNDVTARDLQRKDVQFTRAKSFDTFCPVGPWIETEFVPAGQAIRCTVDGDVRQESSLDRMIHPPEELLAFASSVMTLEPGDVIATGTPKGVGPLRPGSSVSVEIEGIGVLTNPVEEE